MPQKQSEIDIVKKFGLLVKREREARDLSQEKLAELTGFHRNYIGLVERGERNISLRNIKILANFFGKTLGQFLDGID